MLAALKRTFAIVVGLKDPSPQHSWVKSRFAGSFIRLKVNRQTRCEGLELSLIAPHVTKPVRRHMRPLADMVLLALGLTVMHKEGHFWSFSFCIKTIT